MSLPALTFSAGCIILGIVTVLFFQCIGALFDPLNRTRSRGIKWGLVVHTTVMFLLLTVATAMGLNLQSISHIDNREFLTNQFPPGPIGYKFLIYSKAISLVPNLTFQLNQWLADGLLVSFVLNQVVQVLNVRLLQLYRCYVIYAMNYWVVAFPCLMYLTSLGTHSDSPRSPLQYFPLTLLIQRQASCTCTSPRYLGISSSINLL